MIIYKSLNPGEKSESWPLQRIILPWIEAKSFTLRMFFLQSSFQILETQICDMYLASGSQSVLSWKKVRYNRILFYLILKKSQATIQLGKSIVHNHQYANCRNYRFCQRTYGRHSHLLWINSNIIKIIVFYFDFMFLQSNFSKLRSWIEPSVALSRF